MFQIRLLTLLIALAAIIIFYLQNQQSIALIFYGITLPIQFPVSVWVLLSLLAGILTSIILQILSSLGRSKSSEKFRESELYRDSRTTVKKNSSDRKTRSQKIENKRLERPRQEEIDWETPSQKKVDWDGKEIISEPNWTREIKDDFPFKKQPPLEKNYEVEKKPVSENHSGSMYSYSYGESKKTDDQDDRVKKDRPRNIDRVYDANYRVIDAPTDDLPPTNRSNDTDDDEDWI